MSNSRGTALLSVLTTLSILLPVVMHTTAQSHLDLLYARNFRDHTDATYLAEAGLEVALARIGPFGTLRDLTHGRDGVVGTSDDPEWVRTLDDGRHYEVVVQAVGTTGVDVVSTARGRHGARSALAARVETASHPYTPAALVPGANVVFELGPTLQIRGSDTPYGRDPVAAIADAAGLDPRFDVDAILASLASHDLAVRIDAIDGDTFLGDVDTPQLSLIDGDIDIAGAARGAGILLVRGALRLDGSLTFDGMIVVDGDLESTTASELELTGAVWQSPRGSRLRLNGTGSLRFDPVAIERADTAAPGVLPRALRVLGYRELS